MLLMDKQQGGMMAVDTPIKALLIEDDANDVFLMQDMLGSVRGGQPIAIDTKGTLEDGLAYLDDHSVDVVLLDITLPDSQGLATFQVLHERKPDVPVVIVTGYDDTGLGLDAVQQGAQDYLVKGRVDGEGVRRAVHYAIERQLLQNRLLDMQLREQQLRIEKLESLGLLAGGIAHDFNNLLTGILGNLELAGMADTLDDARTLLNSAQAATVRATGLTRQLLTFSKGGDPVTEIASVASVLEEACSFSARGSNVKCEFCIDADLSAAEIDRGQMAQVFQNIVINAIQAMPEGGVIHVAARNVSLRNGRDVGLARGRYVHITFADAGKGIPDQHLSKIFDPYFTTKQKGSGLGLATAYSIVQKHHGTLVAESVLGRGSTFHVYLPACGDVPVLGPVSVAGPLPAGRVLVMDDEEAVRDIAVRYLGRMGFAAQAVRDGQEALEVYRTAMDSGEPFLAVILDLTIPGGMGGEEVIKRLLAIDPEVHAIVSSGFSTHSVMSNYGDYGFRGVVPKPYRMVSLQNALRDVLQDVAPARS